jgi:hypothetical protein
VFPKEAIMTSSAAPEASSADELVRVRRGFAVWLADGRRGSVAEVRRGQSGGVELVVVTGLFFRTHVTVRAAEIEVVQPQLRRVIVGKPHASGQETSVDVDVDTRAAIIRFPTEQASSAGWPRDPA